MFEFEVDVVARFSFTAYIDIPFVLEHHLSIEKNTAYSLGVAYQHLLHVPIKESFSRSKVIIITWELQRNLLSFTAKAFLRVISHLHLWKINKFWYQS